jgi:hypothetical protein
MSPPGSSGERELSCGRDLRVGAAVTRDFKTSPDWKEKFERRLAYASKIFETEFKLSLHAVQYWDWLPEGKKQDSNYLLEDLRDRFPLQEVDLVVGLTRLGRETAGVPPAPTDFALGCNQGNGAVFLVQLSQADFAAVTDDAATQRFQYISIFLNTIYDPVDAADPILNPTYSLSTRIKEAM